MLDELAVANFTALNLLFYLIVSLPLDYFTYIRKNRKTRQDESPSEPNTLVMVLTFILSVYLWIIFVLVSISELISFNIFYYTKWIFFGNIDFILQFLGGCLILIGTFVACWGRISRGTRAFSRGIPILLETKGMYRYIRHPLYASYCCYFIGFPLFLQSFLVLPLILGIPGYYVIAKQEEKDLIKYFGEQYTQYRERTGCFIPRIKKNEK
jgi:protein-S-isoprenylcysteine O-methyltransferase Ste14